jgi:hypothetical protein
MTLVTLKGLQVPDSASDCSGSDIQTVGGTTVPALITICVPLILTRDPTANDDGANTGAAGPVGQGAVCVNTSTTPPTIWQCVSAATAAAVWEQVFPPSATAMAVATDSTAGTMSAADKTKLDGLGTASTHAATDFDVAGAASAAQSAAESASIPAAFLDTDGTMAADSDARVPSQKAVATYVAANAGGDGPLVAFGIATGVYSGSIISLPGGWSGTPVIILTLDQNGPTLDTNYNPVTATTYNVYDGSFELVLEASNGATPPTGCVLNWIAVGNPA